MPGHSGEYCSMISPAPIGRRWRVGRLTCLRRPIYEWAAALPPSPIIAEASASSLPVDDVADCAEPAALTWALDESATALLVKRHGRVHRLEALLLTAFAEATLSWSGQGCLK